MRYEASGLPSGTDNRPSYHCGYKGCGVRYDMVNGYFTLIGMPEEINPVEEPGANTLQCEKHEAWLYRNRNQANEWGDEWCCGVEGCGQCSDRDKRQLGQDITVDRKAARLIRRRIRADLRIDVRLGWFLLTSSL